MSDERVLLLCSGDDIKLMEALARKGLTPLSHSRMTDVLSVVQHHLVSWVLVDNREPDTDVLEIVLNIRDVDPAIPVAVVDAEDRPAAWREALSRIEGVHILPSTNSRRALAGSFQHLTVSMEPQQLQVEGH